MRLLVTVAEAFKVTGRGVGLLPYLDASEAGPRRLRVELRRPDGESIVVEATIEEARVSEPPRARGCVVVLGLGTADVPIGTEVWALD